MYDVAQLKTGLLGSTPLISWRQNPDSSGVQISDVNLIATPTSGMYFNDFHPLLNTNNLMGIAPTYLTGQTGSTLNASFSAWLRQKTEAALIQAVDTWLNEKFSERTARNLLERNTLFRSAVSSRGKDTNHSKFVGFEFVPMRTAGTVQKITEFSLQFDQDCDVTVYLYHSNVATPVYAETINYTGGGGVQWETVNWDLTGDGSWLIGYDQAENPDVQSINGVPDHTHVTGGGHWLPVGKYFNAAACQAEPYSTIGIPDMEIGNDFIVGGSKAFGSEDLSYHWETNYGMNFKFSVQCDYTSLILEQKNLFKQVIGLNTAIKLLEEMIYNPDARVNRHGANAADHALRIAYELDGDSSSLKKSGLRHKLDLAMGAIKFDLTNIDKMCMPCKREGVRFTTI